MQTEALIEPATLIWKDLRQRIRTHNCGANDESSIRFESASGDFRLAVNTSGVALVVTLTSRRKRRCHLVGHARMRWCCATPSLPFQIAFSSRSLVHFEYQSLAERHCTPHIPLTFTRDLSRGHPPIRKCCDYLLIKSLAQALLAYLGC